MGCHVLVERTEKLRINLKYITQLLRQAIRREYFQYCFKNYIKLKKKKKTKYYYTYNVG